MVLLIAYWIAVRAGAEGETAALFAGFCTVGADRLVKLLTDRFLQRVDAELEAQVARTKGLVRQEVQAEMSAKSVIEDNINGRAPDEYVALKPHPQAPQA